MLGDTFGSGNSMMATLKNLRMNQPKLTNQLTANVPSAFIPPSKSQGTRGSYNKPPAQIGLNQTQNLSISSVIKKGDAESSIDGGKQSTYGNTLTFQ
jgi:hypothetical protein